MCKHNATEIYETRREVKEIKDHLGISTTPLGEMPTFFDPFAEWDAEDAEDEAQAQAAPPPRRSSRPRSARDEIFEEDEEEEEYVEEGDEDEDEDDDEESDE